MAETLYVNSATGNDSAAGSQSAPFKTISKALSQVQSGGQIQIANGNYTTSTGESFPLMIPSGAKVIGDEGNKGKGTVIIEGGGDFVSRNLIGAQNVAIVIGNGAQLRGVTVTNGNRRGTGIWIESDTATVANCTFNECDREGIYITGDANPKIIDSEFVESLGQGLTVTKNAKGEVRGNTFIKGGYGVSTDESAAPKMVGNTISENRYGIGAADKAKPVLRNNLIQNNTDNGLIVTGDAFPDLGSSTDPGKNTFRNNAKLDIENFTKNKLVSSGNTLTKSKVKGDVEIKDGSEPTPTPTPPTPTPTPPTPTPPTPTPPTPTPKPTLSDIKGHWAEPFIQGLIDQDIISGFPDGTFKPEAKMTRAQYAALLVKAFNPSPKRNAPNFTDVASNFWAKEVIEKAYRGQFLSGYPNNIFKPNDNVQRVQIMVSLVNGLGLSIADANALNTYDDRNSIPNYAKDEVVTATKKKMVVNYPNPRQLKPTQDANRAEVVAMVYQALVDANRISRIDSPYIVVA
ncbi:MAG: DUF1565 domain-containing protein [Coleofasciculaceae cyanobacterium]